VLWEALTAKRLFRGPQQTDAETLHRILYEHIPRLSEVLPWVPPALDETCACALARPSEERYNSCLEFIAALESLAPKVGGIATAEEVANYVEGLVGAEISMRREAIRTANSPVFPSLATVLDEYATVPDLPRFGSSVSKDDSLTQIKRRPARSSLRSAFSLLLGAVAGGLVAALIVFGLVWFVKL